MMGFTVLSRRVAFRRNSWKVSAVRTVKQMHITIGASVMEKLAWKYEQRVDIGVGHGDDEGTLIIFPAKPGMYQPNRFSGNSPTARIFRTSIPGFPDEPFKRVEMEFDFSTTPLGLGLLLTLPEKFEIAP